MNIQGIIVSVYSIGKGKGMRAEIKCDDGITRFGNVNARDWNLVIPRIDSRAVLVGEFIKPISL